MGRARRRAALPAQLAQASKKCRYNHVTVQLNLFCYFFVCSKCIEPGFETCCMGRDRLLDLCRLGWPRDSALRGRQSCRGLQSATRAPHACTRPPPPPCCSPCGHNALTPTGAAGLTSPIHCVTCSAVLRHATSSPGRGMGCLLT